MAHYSIIAAIGENRELGLHGQLPWERIPADMNHFKELTLHHTVVMGRNTWNSLSIKPLPNRRNIVLTKQHTNIPHSVEIATSIQEVIDLTQKEEEVFIIGGAKVYAHFLDIAEKIYLTRINAVFDADVFFPELDTTIWKMTTETVLSPDETTKYDINFQKYEKLRS